jgi:hypothetical protein
MSPIRIRPTPQFFIHRTTAGHHAFSIYSCCVQCIFYRKKHPHTHTPITPSKKRCWSLFDLHPFNLVAACAVVVVVCCCLARYTSPLLLLLLFASPSLSPAYIAGRTRRRTVIIALLLIEFCGPLLSQSCDWRLTRGRPGS